MMRDVPRKLARSLAQHEFSNRRSACNGCRPTKKIARKSIVF